MQQKHAYANFDPVELNKFSALAATWWDPTGKLKTLHQINPLRLNFILSQTKLSQQSILDIGCGAGILSESLAQHNAKVTGIDLSPELIQAANLHQYESKTQIEYLCISVEELSNQRPGEYDIITCMELLEHVPDPTIIIQAAATLLKPGGHAFFSTLNRNFKSYCGAILAAEYLLQLLPKNTHDFAKFIQPAELCSWLRAAKLKPRALRGVSYNIFTRNFSLTSDLSINYLLHATKGVCARSQE